MTRQPPDPAARARRGARAGDTSGPPAPGHALLLASLWAAACASAPPPARPPCRGGDGCGASPAARAPEAAAPTAPPAPPADPMFMGGPRRTGQSAARGPRRAAPRALLAGGGRLTAAPLVLGDGDLVVASLDGRVRRISPGGALRWERALGAPVQASGATDGRALYFGTRAGTVHALDMGGRERWRRTLGAPVLADLLLADETLYVAADGLHALTTAGGGSAWHHVTADRLAGAPAWHPAGMVVFGTMHGRVRAVGPGGRLRWESEGGAAIEAGVAVTEDGAILVGNLLGDVLCLDAQGRERWRHVPEAEHAIRATVALSSDGRAVFGGSDGVVRSLDVVDGSPRWSLATAGPIVASARLDAEGVAFVGSRDGAVYAIGGDGSLHFRYTVGQDIDATPALARDGTLYVGADDGILYAFPPQPKASGDRPAHGPPPHRGPA